MDGSGLARTAGTSACTDTRCHLGMQISIYYSTDHADIWTDSF